MPIPEAAAEPGLARALDTDPDLGRRVWEFPERIDASTLLEEKMRCIELASTRLFKATAMHEMMSGGMGGMMWGMGLVGLIVLVLVVLGIAALVKFLFSKG